MNEYKTIITFKGLRLGRPATKLQSPKAPARTFWQGANMFTGHWSQPLGFTPDADTRRSRRGEAIHFRFFGPLLRLFIGKRPVHGHTGNLRAQRASLIFGAVLAFVGLRATAMSAKLNFPRCASKERALWAIQRIVLEHEVLVMEWLRATVSRLIQYGPVPEHLAIIMDGNRRFAQRAAGGDVRQGHTKGFDKVSCFYALRSVINCIHC